MSRRTLPVAEMCRELCQFAHRQIGPILDQSGEVLYSAAATLTPGSVYVIGHNPGASPTTKARPTIRRCLARLRTKTLNNYIDLSWHGRPPGRAPLQLRVTWLLTSLGLDPHKIAASNLIFTRSRNVATSRFDRAELCWPVHERILDIVRPSLVIAFGNSGDSPYNFLKRKFLAESERCTSAGHGNWKCRAFVVPGKFIVIGLPHLSRYKIDKCPHVVHWIERQWAPIRR
jgi:hypothetical protein